MPAEPSTTGREPSLAGFAAANATWVTVWDREQSGRALAAVRHADRRSRGTSAGRGLPLAAQKEDRQSPVVVVEVLND